MRFREFAMRLMNLHNHDDQHRDIDKQSQQISNRLNEMAKHEDPMEELIKSMEKTRKRRREEQ